MALKNQKLVQVNTKLFAGFVDGHNGTYMNEFGLSFHSLRAHVILATESGEIIGMSSTPVQEVPQHLLYSPNAS